MQDEDYCKHNGLYQLAPGLAWISIESPDKLYCGQAASFSFYFFGLL